MRLTWVRWWGQGTLLSQQCEQGGGEAGGGAVFRAFMFSGDVLTANR